MKCAAKISIHTFLIFALSQSNHLSSQALISLQVNGYGKVVANITCPPILNPILPIYLNRALIQKNAVKKDSLETESIYFSGYGKHVSPFAMRTICADSLNLFHSFLFGNPQQLVNSTDLTQFRNVPTDCSEWQELSTHTYEFSCYLLGPYGYNLKQLWTLDSKQRVKEIIQYDQQGYINMRLTIFYTPENQVASFKQQLYRRDEGFSVPRVDSAIVNTVWVRDQNKRMMLMFKYAGVYKPIANKKIVAYGDELIQSIVDREHHSQTAFDGIDVRELVVYQYGKYGVERVYFCHQEMLDEFNPTYYKRYLLVDSLFYDQGGRITKYVCTSNKQGYFNQAQFFYTNDSNQVAYSKSTTLYPDNWFTETQNEQWYRYNNGRVSYMRILKKERQYKRPLSNDTIPPFRIDYEKEDWMEWK